MCNLRYRTVEHEDLEEVTGFDCYYCGSPETVMLEGEDKCPRIAAWKLGRCTSGCAGRVRGSMATDWLGVMTDITYRHAATCKTYTFSDVELEEDNNPGLAEDREESRRERIDYERERAERLDFEDWSN